MRLELRRVLENSDGTFGLLLFPNFTPEIVTLEDVWLGNDPNVSCIPVGYYGCVRHTSPRFGETFWVTNVPGRSEILFHVGNVAGRAATVGGDTRGCILPGQRYHYFKSKKSWGVSGSRKAFQRFMLLLEGVTEFELVVTNKGA